MEGVTPGRILPWYLLRRSGTFSATMIKERRLDRAEAASAEAIQAAVDALGGNGRLILPEMDLTVDRGIELRSGVELVGQGERTILRKGSGRVYPLTGYHNYGMQDVPLQSTAGLAPGMTVCVLDDQRRGFYETFSRITWIDGKWVGLDTGLSADYLSDQYPRLTTAYPMIFGRGIKAAAVRDVVLDGRRDDQDIPMGGCRGGAIYFARSSGVEVTGVRERDYHGEGMSFQMCRDVAVVESAFSGNSGNGIHPGAGSTNCLVEHCQGLGNESSGFFFCVRANHITVRDCAFENNGDGISMGTRDCHNLVEGCRIAGNRGPGILTRPGASPVEVHSCRIRRCSLEENAVAEGEGQVVIADDAHDLAFEENEIKGDSDVSKPGIVLKSGVRRVTLRDNRIAGCDPDVHADESSLSTIAREFSCGYGIDDPSRFRHLPKA